MGELDLGLFDRVAGLGKLGYLQITAHIQDLWPALALDDDMVGVHS